MKGPVFLLESTTHPHFLCFHMHIRTSKRAQIRGFCIGPTADILGIAGGSNEQKNASGRYSTVVFLRAGLVRIIMTFLRLLVELTIIISVI